MALLIVGLMLLSLFPAPPAVAALTSVNLTYPNEGDDLVGGSMATIKWSVSSTGGYVRIDLSIRSGEGYETIDTIPNSPRHGIGEYEWFVPPNINETTCRIKLTWTDTVTKPIEVLGEDESTGDFAIAPGVALHFTDVPDTMSFGAYQLITFDLWDPYDMVGGLRFTWHVDEGSGYGAWEALPGNYDYYDKTRGWIWWMPEYYESATAQIMVEALPPHGTTAIVSDVTPAFEIVSPTVTLLSHDGGVVMVGGTTQTIEWRTASDPEKVIMGVNIDYSLDGGGYWNPIRASGPNDFSEQWTVPTGVDSTEVLIRVTALWGEWYILDWDVSSMANTIISDASALTVTLDDPNPPVDGGVIVGSGETYTIQWSTTGDERNMKEFRLFLSTDGGSVWSSIGTAASTSRQYQWTVPAVDTTQAKVKVELHPMKFPSTPKVAQSVHTFIIFDQVAINRPPVAMVGPDLEGNEGEIIGLDGATSYDPDGDTLAHHWTQVEPAFKPVTLSSETSATPWFMVDLTHFPVTFVFELEVSDGNEHPTSWLWSVQRVTVVVQPDAPALTRFYPDTGWEGTLVTIEGTDLMGAEVLVGSQVITSVPTSAVVGNPDPDHQYTFALPPGVDTGKGQVSVRNLAGDHAPGWEYEVFPVPQWQFDYGLGFQNPTDHILSYPWWPGGDGNYKDSFGDQVYLSIWICIGIPYWTPWDGWDCLGYLIKEPFVADPLAAIYYGAFYCWIARAGECFGMSTTALQFYHGELSKSSFEPGAVNISDLSNTGDLNDHVDAGQGAQLSAEILNHYLHEFIDGLIPSTSTTGLGKFEKDVKAAIDSGDLGIISMVEDHGAHAVVPYAYEDVDATHTRIYIYDSNRAWLSNPDSARAANRDEGIWPVNRYPSYIEIEKSGTYWTWSFRAVDNAEWRSKVGIAFVPWSKVNGPRTLPLSLDLNGLLILLAGDAESGTIDDGSGNSLGYDADGNLVSEIPDGKPLPFLSGAGDRVKTFFTPQGDYVAHVEGVADGVYNWSVINNGTSAFWLESAEVTNGSSDTIEISYADGNPYRGAMSFGSSDTEKECTVSMVNAFGERQRVYRLKNIELMDDGRHGDGRFFLEGTDDYNGMTLTNLCSETVTFGVEFQTNVVSEGVWNGTSRPTSLPTASREGISVGPGETVVIAPTDWLDLDNALVVIEGETVPGTPVDLSATNTADGVVLDWSAPGDDGGWPVMEYVVYRGPSADNLTLLASTSGNTFVDDGVVEGETYHYTVLARNALGDGPPTVDSSILVSKEGGDDDDDGGIPWPLIIGIIIVLVAIGAGVMMMGGRKQGGPETMAPMAETEGAPQKLMASTPEETRNDT